MKIASAMRAFVFLVAAALGLTLAFFLVSRYSPELTRMVDSDLMRFLDQPFFHLGNQPVSMLFVLKAILYLIFLGLVVRMVRRFLRYSVLARTSMDPGQQYALARMAGYVVFVLGIIIGLQSAGLDLSSLVVVGGALGIGVGFGLQTIASNFVSGLVLLIERPIKLGDRVEVGDTYGDVVRIAGRSTWIRTNDNVVIIVPNSEFIEKRVVNWTANDRQVRFSVDLGVSYGSKPEQVREILLEVAQAHPEVLVAPPPEVLFTGFGDSSLNFSLRVWTDNVQQPRRLKSDLYFATFKAFAEQGIEIPFPQRDLHLKSVHVPISVTSKS